MRLLPRFCVVSALIHALFISLISTQAVNKTNIVKIGLLLPFGIPGIPVDYWSTLGAASAGSYNAIIWYLNKINSQTDILPDVQLQLVTVNSMYDRGMTLTGAQTLASQGAFALIGELASRNSVTASLVASIAKIMHCNPFATSALLSNKGGKRSTTYSNADAGLTTIQDYPYAFRTIPTVPQYVAAILAAVQSQNVTTISILSSDDESGQSIIQELSAQAKSKNITVKGFVQLTPGKKSYMDELQIIKSFKTQTVIVGAASGGDAARKSVSAKNLTMLNGDYWFINGVGFDASNFQAPDELDALASMQGVWQVFGRRNYVGEFKEFENYWNSQFYPNGTLMVNNPGASCDMTVPFARGCMGSGPGIAGTMPEFIKTYKYNQPLTLDYFVYVEIEFEYLKNKIITVADITSRKVLTAAAAGNISQYLNQVPVPDNWGKTWRFDKNGDPLMDVAIWNYKYDAVRKSVWGAEIGYWQQSSDSLKFAVDPIFIGNRTSAPMPPPIPVLQYQAKMSLRYAFDGIIAFCSLVSLGLAGTMIMYLKQRIFKASSPIFLGLIILGANVSFISIWLYSEYPLSNSSCITYGWLKYLGFAVVFGSLIVKTYRIFVIFTTKNKNKQNLNDGVLVGYFLVLIAIWVVILLVWTIVPAQRPFLDSEIRYRLADDGSVSMIDVTPFCNFTSYNYVCLAAMVLTLVYGVFLTYSVRNTPGAFNESKWMAYGIYNWVVIGIVLNAIANFAVSNPDTIFVMEALTVIITQTGVCALMIVPKLIVISQGLGDEIDTFESAGSSSKRASLSGGRNSTITGALTLDQSKEIEQLKHRLQEREREIEKASKRIAEVLSENERLKKERTDGK
ncbi:hypothetical protein HDU97_005654 [Phlyctochytrium planicorne]|nr:hypothetical protein HDU97_005654 [Phlyctochytrium planicorne]